LSATVRYCRPLLIGIKVIRSIWLAKSYVKAVSLTN